MTKPLRKNVVSLRAGQNPDRVLVIDSCEITPVSEETGRWSRMDSNPFARSIFFSTNLHVHVPKHWRVAAILSFQKAPATLSFLVKRLKGQRFSCKYPPHFQ